MKTQGKVRWGNFLATVTFNDNADPRVELLPEGLAAPNIYRSQQTILQPKSS